MLRCAGVAEDRDIIRSVRFPGDLYRAIEEHAKQHGLTFNRAITSVMAARLKVPLGKRR